MEKIRLTNSIYITDYPNNEHEVQYYFPDINTINQKVTKKYHSKTIQEKARISAIQISHWTKTGVIIPAIVAKGTGKMHVYDHQNLIEAMLCRELSEYSINYGVMREVLDFLREKIWLFEIYLSSPKLSRLHREPEDIPEAEYLRRLEDAEDEEGTTKKIRLTIWDFFKQYPQNGSIYLLLWKDSRFTELSEAKKGEYNIHITTTGINDVTHRCSSLIILNLTLLLSEAGHFSEEVDN